MSNQGTPYSDDHRLVSAQVYQSLREAHRSAQQVMANFGTWLITTITAVQIAGIYLIASLPDIDLAVKERPIKALVAGLVLIFASGLAAWINWGALAKLYGEWADARMLVGMDAWPKQNARLDAWIWHSYVASVLFGVYSVGCVPLAAYLFFSAASPS